MILLQILIFEKQDKILKTIDIQKNNHAKAKAVFDVIYDKKFWENISLFAQILELLAVIAFTFQANDT